MCMHVSVGNYDSYYEFHSMCLVIRHVPLHAVLATLKLRACQECTCVWSEIL